MSIEINIEGMSCQHCVQSATKALKEVTGVEVVEVSLENKNATVTGTANKEDLISAINNAGFTAS